MIPSNIRRKHVLKAIEHMDFHGVPVRRGSHKYHLVYNGKDYPPKYAVALANRFANGLELDPSEFSGGNETNSILESLGFIISGPGKVISRQTSTVAAKKQKPAREKHDERCSECKNTLIEMFRRLYGTVKIDYKIDTPARLEGYQGTSAYNDLSSIYSALTKYRNHSNFVRLNHLHRCDLFIPDPGFVVEFDESQHFSRSRYISLSQYPSRLPLGFDLKQWEDLCNQLDSKDRDPVYRDEQRAWYDTLRDFLPLTKGLLPTVRVPMGDCAWCELDIEADIQILIKKLKLPSPASFAMKSASNSPHPMIVASVVISGSADTGTNERLRLLKNILGNASTLDVIPHLFVLPAGYFSTRKIGTRFAEKVGDKVKNIIKMTVPESVVCFGVDGRNGVDQLGIAISNHGIIAAGRKFFPTKDEVGYIQTSEDTNGNELGLPRHFKVRGRNVYLAVCYDGFGIRHLQLQNPGIDVVVDLVHGFYNRGEGGSGDVYFARHGFAGASKQWDCPVIGAASFFNRPIPQNWPSFVLWNQGVKRTNEWSYKDNPLTSNYSFTVRHGNEIAEVRVSELK